MEKWCTEGIESVFSQFIQLVRIRNEKDHIEHEVFNLRVVEKAKERICSNI